MKKLLGLLIFTLLITTGCGVSLKSNAPEKIKKDVADKASGVVEEGTERAKDTVKNEIVKELTAKEIVISTDSISPTSIDVLKDQEVKLKISSGDGKTHGFYLPDYDITETVKESGNQVVTFKADKKGNFIYSCNLNCDSGVSGTLNVK